MLVKAGSKTATCKFGLGLIDEYEIVAEALSVNLIRISLDKKHIW